jgi:protein SCO1/2
MKRRIIRFIILSVIGVSIGILMAFVFEPSGEEISKKQIQAKKTTLSAPAVQIGGNFELIAHNGMTVTQSSWPRSYKLIFFGFTHCFDICPSALQKMTDLIDVLGKDSINLQPLFITIDPDRDSPDMMADFLQAFDPKILGLTGDKKQIEAVKDIYHLYARAQKGTDQIDHAASMYFMAPDGRYITMFSGSTTVENMADQIREIFKNKEKM